jgi:hypothetical protein
MTMHCESEEEDASPCPFPGMAVGATPEICSARDEPIVISTRYVEHYCTKARHVECSLYLLAQASAKLSSQTEGTAGDAADEACQQERAAAVEPAADAAVMAGWTEPEAATKEEGQQEAQPVPAVSVEQIRSAIQAATPDSWQAGRFRELNARPPGSPQGRRCAEATEAPPPEVSATEPLVYQVLLVPPVTPDSIVVHAAFYPADLDLVPRAERGE